MFYQQNFMQSTDTQTLKELEIFESGSGNDFLLTRLDFTRTRRGRIKLREKLLHYYTSLEEIYAVQDCLRFLSTNLENWNFNLHEEEILHLENYFYSNISPIFSATKLDTLLQIARYQVLYKNEYAYIRGGTFRLLSFLQGSRKQLDQIKKETLPVLLHQWIEKIESILNQKQIKQALNKFAHNKLDFVAIIEYDRLFRVHLKDHIIDLLDLLAELDALLSMAKSIRKYQLVFPEFVDTQGPCIELENIYHLFIDSPVSNNLRFNAQKNFLFLTGPNMAGKTTLLKAVGMAMYLAHIGMGIPASCAKLSVFTGIFSSISPTDNLGAGYSYFYSEVMRVKEAVNKLKANTSVFFMFDELFRGTNVKDAYDCSKLVVDGLQQWKNSVYIVSSHITELATDMEQYPNISFRYMESAIEGHNPVFSYKLAEGVSKERLGLLILENEKIFE
jgi:DNA mismatch repair protein MutS